jgi:hypothetical protein
MLFDTYYCEFFYGKLSFMLKFRSNKPKRPRIFNPYEKHGVTV